MNASNPFQIPACLQREDLQQRRQKRFKKVVIAIIAAAVLMLIGLLIEGCESERTANATSITPLGEVPAAVATQTAALPMEQHLQPNPQQPVVPQIAPLAVQKESAMTPVSQPGAIYVVKPGDVLTRIAKAHKTTVKAIEAANGLSSDRIAAGTKLKMPAS